MVIQCTATHYVSSACFLVLMLQLRLNSVTDQFTLCFIWFCLCFVFLCIADNIEQRVRTGQHRQYMLVTSNYPSHSKVPPYTQSFTTDRPKEVVLVLFVICGSFVLLLLSYFFFVVHVMSDNVIISFGTEIAV